VRIGTWLYYRQKNSKYCDRDHILQDIYKQAFKKITTMVKEPIKKHTAAVKLLFKAESVKPNVLSESIIKPPEFNAMDVSIILVNWNTGSELRNCLHSIFEQTRSISFEVIVIDNCSSDGSMEMLGNEFPQITQIRNNENRGFAAANNQGLCLARGRYALLLNPDTLILDNAIQKVIGFADEHADAAVVGCQVLENDTKIQQTCGCFPSVMELIWHWTRLLHFFPRSSLFAKGTIGWWDRTTERDVDVISGMFMLVRREAIEQVGLMDEDYFVYGEETDWCFRFRKAGWRCIFTPSSRIIHLDGGSKSTSQMEVRMFVQLQKSLLIFYRKHRGNLAWAVAKLLYILAMFCRAVVSWIRMLSSRDALANRQWKQSIAALRFHLLRH
jgi:GT2 family glycosyltransferase